LEKRKGAKIYNITVECKALENRRFSASVCLIFATYNFNGDKIFAFSKKIIVKKTEETSVFSFIKTIDRMAILNILWA